MADNGSSAKRPRTSDDPVSIENRIKHAKLWFEDGNIILTTTHSVFRVHRGLLSTSASVFADMLSIPQPENDEDSFLGLPVVEMFDDDKDVTHFLHVLYDREYYRGGSETTFEKISGLLRMSTKYHFASLRKEVISHLAVAYPATGDKYKTALDPKTQQALFPPFPGQHFAVAALARDTDATILLPSALWRSSCEKVHHIFNGIEDSDGLLHRLSPKDIQICMKVKHETILKHLVHDSRRTVVLFKSCENAESERHCKNLACTSIVNKCTGIVTVNQFELYDALIDWDPFHGSRPHFCGPCTRFVETYVHDERERRWEHLPAFFDLGKWKDIIQQASA